MAKDRLDFTDVDDTNILKRRLLWHWFLLSARIMGSVIFNL
jgi:hypothetical protein